MAGRGEIVEDAALLLTQSITDGEHAFDEAAALRTVRAEAGMSPQDPMPQGSLSVIVGGLDTWFAYEGPQGGLDIEES